VRFCATGFWPKEMQLYLTNRAEYFRRLDGVVQAAKQNGIGMVPSLFWFYATAPDLVGEPVDEWANPQSKTQAFMREYVREVVTRYRDNPAIWAWEFGNEYALEASLPNAKEHRPPVQPELGTPASRSERDELTFAMVRRAFAAFGNEVRKYDSHRLVETGDSFLRASAWHQEHEGQWTTDTPEEFAEMLTRGNPAPMSAISVHMYQDNEALMGQAVRVARQLGQPLFVGEWGAPGATPETEATCRRQLKAICDNDVCLAALWVFDLASQKDFSVTATNARAWQLDLIAQANRTVMR
jgi:sugar phosphate isomerase/epimerase